MTRGAAPTARRLAGLLAAGATDRAYALGWAGVRALPEPAALTLSGAAADLALLRGGPGVERLAAHLQRVAPGSDLLPAALRSYARYWCEVFRLPAMPRERIVGGMRVVHEERLREAVAAPTGTVLALPHSGNWDHAGAWCSSTGIPFTTVAERLRPEPLYERFAAFREQLGMEVLPLSGGASVYRVLRSRLAAGGTLCLLADRDLSRRGVDVQFFGAPARMPPGPARLALATGARLLPVTLSFRPDGWQAVIWPAVQHTDVARMTQSLADVFAAGIAAAPADWHALQPVWLDELADTGPRAPAGARG